MESNNTERTFDNSSENRYNLSQENLWNRLTKQDQAILYRSIDEIHHQGYSKYRLENGDYVIDVNNKIVITDGAFQRPLIKCLIEFNQLSNKISEARDLIYENIDRRPVWEVIEDINIMCQEEVATFYGQKNSKYNRESSEQGRDYSKNRGDSQEQQRRGSSKDARYSINNKEGVNNGEENAERGQTIDEEDSNANSRRQDLGNIWGQRENKVSAIERFQEDSKRARLETREDRLEYLNILRNNNHTKVGIDYIGVDNFISYETNNHERMHNIERKYPDIFNDFFL